MKALITGFGPFPGTAINPSAAIVEAIDEKRLRLPRGLEARTAILETDWLKAPVRLSALLVEHGPDFLLHLGVADTVGGFRIEQMAHNRTKRLPDVDGRLPKSTYISCGGPERIKTTFNTTRLVSALTRKSIPASLSRNAGAYLCNMLYYISLRAFASAERDAPALFVHIPAEGRLARPGDLFTGVQIILRTCMTDRVLQKREVISA